MLTKECLQQLRSKAVELPQAKTQENGASSITVVNHKNGKRVTITPALYKELGSPKTVQFSIVPEEQVLLIGEELGMRNSYTVRTTGKPTVYKASLAEQIAAGFHLDFTNKSSISFSEVDVDSLDDDAKIAVVKMNADKKRE